MNQTRPHSVSELFTAVGGPLRLKVSDLTRDSHRSVDSDWSSAELVVKALVIRSGGTVIRRIAGDRLPVQPGFSADVWWDEDGNRHWRGHVEDGVGWRMHPGAWVELSTTLAPGDYELQVQLGSSLRSNNVNDHMLAQVLATATENIEATASGQRFYEQIKALLESSLQRPTSDEQVTQMLNVLTEVAVDASSRGDWFFDEQSRCDTWSIWPGEELTHEENMVRYGDPVGMMRGWTALLHGIMTSYEYLHD